MASVVKITSQWLVTAVVGITTAAACGGRGNLPVGSMDDEGGSNAGGNSSGGASAGVGVGGSRSGASSGGAAVGGTAVGGAAVGGAAAIGGSAGNGGLARCGPGAPCRFPDTVCQNGLCVPQVCVPGSVRCEQNTVRVCSADGTGSFVQQVCAGDQYCDAEAKSCKPGVCAPNRPVCVGEVASTCNANGSGYVLPSEDCRVGENRHCTQGVCACDDWKADCDGILGCEIDLFGDPNNCHGCGISCSSHNMATRTCSGVCDGLCKAGFDDCNGDKQGDGCETRIEADVNNCGGCNIACSANHLKPTCNDGTCDGACDTNFADCNLDKQADGCESDSRSDVNNCGGCGVRCSSNHISRACSAGVCSGTCTTGFRDCNGDKQSDGCEIDVRSNAEHCGACDSPCPEGESCSNGRCSSLFTFSGIKQNLATSSLVGWSECFSQQYGGESSLTDVLQQCSGGQLLLACRKLGTTTLQLAAHAPRADVLRPTMTEQLHEANGVGWYHSESESWGFAPAGQKIELDSCDVIDSSLRPGNGASAALRLCWHLSNGSIRRGWRCGANDNLNDSQDFERVIFHAP